MSLSKVLNHLNELNSLYLKLGETNRAISFRKSHDAIQDMYTEDNFPSDVSLLPKIPGVGASTLKEIDQVLKSGTSDRLEELKEKAKNIAEITKVDLSVLNSLSELIGQWNLDKVTNKLFTI